MYQQQPITKNRELTFTKRAVLLARKWSGQDPRNYHMSEKLDGVRAVWTGECFISRNGNLFDVPQWYCDKMPRGEVLDGELFLGPGKFNAVAGAVRTKKTNCDPTIWHNIRYFVFDAPNHGGTFEQRLGWLRHLCKNSGDRFDVVEHYEIPDNKTLNRFYRHVVSNGGEGVMLRLKQSLYESKRSSTLLKIKPSCDIEAMVVGHEPGTGKNEGRMGAYVCVLESGVRFRLGVGITDSERDNPSPVGAALTVRYQELTPAGKPRFPVLVGARNYE